ncbi:MAG: endonuclease III [Phycisphaerae bacterium]
MSKRAVEKRRKLRGVRLGLVRMYGAVDEHRRRRGAGLDTLVEAMLAQNTNMANATAGYRMLRRRFATWAEVMAAPVGDVQREIAICGLARMRARRLQDLLRKIEADRGRLSIDFLAGRTAREAYDYLMAFHGIGPKTAVFTLLFGFGHPVLPVDNGVLRVVRRLRLVRAKARDLEAERVLSPLIAEGDHLATHRLTFRHAKERCRPKNPKCGECALLAACPYGQRRVKHRPVEVEGPVKRKRVRLAGYVSAGIAKREEAMW